MKSLTTWKLVQILRENRKDLVSHFTALLQEMLIQGLSYHFFHTSFHRCAKIRNSFVREMAQVKGIINQIVCCHVCSFFVLLLPLFWHGIRLACIKMEVNTGAIRKPFLSRKNANPYDFSESGVKFISPIHIQNNVYTLKKFCYRNVNITFSLNLVNLRDKILSSSALLSILSW